MVEYINISIYLCFYLYLYDILTDEYTSYTNTQAYFTYTCFTENGTAGEWNRTI